MNSSQKQDIIPVTASPSPGGEGDLSQKQNLQQGAASQQSYPLFAFSVAVLAVLFIKPLYDLVGYALNSSLYSHVLLIPCVSLYLLWRNKTQRASQTARVSTSKSQHETSRVGAIIPFVLGLGALAFYWFSYRNAPSTDENDYLTLTILAFVSFVAGFYLLFLGKNIFNSEGFPIAFLFFMVPFPTLFTNGIEMFFQHASASAADVMFQITNAPVYRRGLEFRLPEITIAVAPECSGIRSTLVLFITSLIAGHLFLASPWKKAVLTLFVIPLAIMRNGFRIFVIAQLCIHRGPEMIDSVIHRRGGPLFFLLSLIPFFLLIYFLRRSGVAARPSTGLKAEISK